MSTTAVQYNACIILCMCVPILWQVMEAYAGGLKAMKSALNALPMSKEELEDLMDQIQDVCVFTLIVLCTSYVLYMYIYPLFCCPHHTLCDFHMGGCFVRFAAG